MKIIKDSHSQQRREQHMDLPEVSLEVLADYLFEVEHIRAIREEEIECGRIVCGESPVDLSDFARGRVGRDGDGECTRERRGDGDEEAMYGKTAGVMSRRVVTWRTR
jgi:hypothetical protein